MARPGIDILGKRFGRLVVIRSRIVKRKTQWVCRCDCGIKKTIATASLVNGVTSSCGCLYRESRHTVRLTHGKSKTTEHIAWCMMKTRCYNPRNKDYQNYGGRGIAVCDEWRDNFAAFYAHVGTKPGRGYSIDRYPNKDGHYEPGNVRWATDKEQGNNKRNNCMLTHGGVTLALPQWADRIGIARGTLKQRLRYGWSVERALTEPLHFQSTIS